MHSDKMRKCIVIEKSVVVICVALFIGGLFFLLKSEREYGDLGDHYFYMSEYDAMDMGVPDGAFIYKSREKNSWGDNEIKIHRDVIKAKNDKDFIIAIRRKKQNGTLQYYIIAKYSDTVYGPFQKEDYLKKREDLFVSKKLIFEEK